MKSYIKSIIFLSCVLVVGNYVCGTEDNQNKKMPEPKENITIIATYKIDEGHANEDVRIINDENTGLAKTRTGIDSIEICKLDNNNEPQVEHMGGNGEEGEIDKDHVFGIPGVYKIYYYFKEDVTDMSYMFFQCYSLTSLDLSNFNTQNVTDMSYMLFQCYSLTSLNISKFNTNSVTNMACMFQGCSSLTSLNLSIFNTEKVVNMDGMFYGCSSLKTLDLSNFNTEKVGAKKDLFDGCSKLNQVTTNDKHIKELCETNKVAVLSPNKKEVNIEIGDNQNLLKGDSQTQSNSNCWCCPCWKNR